MARTKQTPRVKPSSSLVSRAKLMFKANQAKALTAEQQKRKDAKSHKDQKLNQWKPDDMKAAIDQYFAQKLPSWDEDRDGPKLSIRYRSTSL